MVKRRETTWKSKNERGRKKERKERKRSERERERGIKGTVKSQIFVGYLISFIFMNYKIELRLYKRNNQDSEQKKKENEKPNKRYYAARAAPMYVSVCICQK